MMGQQLLLGGASKKIIIVDTRSNNISGSPYALNYLGFSVGNVSPIQSSDLIVSCMFGVDQAGGSTNETPEWRDNGFPTDMTVQSPNRRVAVFTKAKAYVPLPPNHIDGLYTKVFREATGTPFFEASEINTAIAGNMTAFRNAALGPIGTLNGRSTPSSTITLAGVTTTKANSLLIAVVAFTGTTGTVTAPGMTEISGSQAPGTSAYLRVVAHQETIAAAGATGTRVFTGTGTRNILSGFMYAVQRR